MPKVRTLETLEYRAALYMRLSKDDEGVGESASITTQRKMLRAYANENNFNVFDEYVDDGVSGTTFNRREFKRMIRDIEDKKVNLVITKDLSRLGREYIQTGQYTEVYFPLKQVRYIAINDGYDSDSPYTDIAPFKNVINEMYARDTSKKIRSAFVTLMQEGLFISAFAPYGYKRDTENKHHLVIDEESARIVSEIFSKASKGYSPIEIARELNSKRVLTPAMYRCKNNPSLDIDNYSQRKEWTSATITKMLSNTVYLGHMAQGKTTKVSLKSNVTISHPKDKWYVIENTHQPIVSQDVFDLASRRIKLRKCKKEGNFSNIFSGIAKCADCGHNMSSTKSNKKGSQANLVCGKYKLYGKNECSNHFIDYDELYKIVLTTLKDIFKIDEIQKDIIIKKAQNEYLKQSATNKNSKVILELRKRLKDISGMFEKIYEDHIKELINEETAHNLLNKYQAEKNNINNKLLELDKAKTIDDEDIYLKLKAKIEEYTNIKELSPELLYRLIDHINISQGGYVKTDNSRIKKQEITIFLRTSGSTVSKQITT